jgi:hypothetical protein
VKLGALDPAAIRVEGEVVFLRNRGVDVRDNSAPRLSWDNVLKMINRRAENSCSACGSAQDRSSKKQIS